MRASEGYNPRPRISFPVPLGVGTEGLDEVMEFDLSDWTPLSEIVPRLREQLPKGLSIKSLALVGPGKKARAGELTYRVAPRDEVQGDDRLTPQALERFMARDEVLAQRIRKGRQKVANIRPFVLSLKREAKEIVLRAKAGPDGSTRPEEVLAALGFDDAACRSQFRIVRSRVQLAD